MGGTVGLALSLLGHDKPDVLGLVREPTAATSSSSSTHRHALPLREPSPPLRAIAATSSSAMHRAQLPPPLPPPSLPIVPAGHAVDGTVLYVSCWLAGLGSRPKHGSPRQARPGPSQQYHVSSRPDRYDPFGHLYLQCSWTVAVTYSPPGLRQPKESTIGRHAVFLVRIMFEQRSINTIFLQWCGFNPHLLWN